MNRKSREITDKKEILELLGRCDTIRLGLTSERYPYPYVVPVSFGLDLSQEEPTIYIHGASHGLKAGLIRQNRNVCVEADIFYRVEKCEKGVTTRYESVIGFGLIYEAEESEKAYGLTKILEHYQVTGFPLSDCADLSHTAVYKIILRSLSGKRNLPMKDTDTEKGE